MSAPFPIVSSLEEYFDQRRFMVEAHRGWGEAATWLLRELEGGRRYILKQAPARDPDAPNEVLVGRLYESLGYDYSEARFAVPGRRDLSITQHAEDLPSVGVLLGAADHVFGGDFDDWPPERTQDLARALADPLEPMRLLVADFVTGQSDRHEGDWLLATDVHDDQ